MNALLTFAPGFLLEDVDTLTVTYWARIFTADGDRCFVELSSDSLVWQIVDVLEGMQPPWRRRAIDFAELIAGGAEKAWFRFRFESDDKIGSIGVILDDFQVFSTPVNLTEEASAVGSFAADRQGALVAVPNPFNASVSLMMVLSEPALAQLTVVDLRGRIVHRSDPRHYPSGRQVWVWDAEDMPSGLYFARITLSFSGGRHENLNHKLLLIK